MSTHITEIIPDFDEWPEWAIDAFKSGQFFRGCLDKVAELEKEIERLKYEKVHAGHHRRRNRPFSVRSKT